MDPETQFRIGLVSASVFANEVNGEGGKRTVRSVTVERSYRPSCDILIQSKIPSFELNRQNIVYPRRQLGRSDSVTKLASVPAVTEAPGPDAKRRFVQFFSANLNGAKDIPLFCTIGKRRELTETRMHSNDALRVIKRRAIAAGVSPRICSHTFRATGIIEEMRNGGTLEKAAHASSKTTNVYNRVSDDVTLDEVERIII